ncbi:MAG: hypothetical protein ACTJHW_01915 [Paenalcaligenes sp.]
MDKQKMKWIIPAAVAGVAVLWWGASSYASGKAEDSLRTKLAAMGMQDQVHWADLSASPFGTVTLKDVTVTMSPRDQVQAKEVQISDVIEDAKRQRIALSVKGLVLPDGKSNSMLGNSLGLASGRAELSPMDVVLKADVRFDDNQADIALSVEQKDMADLDFKVSMTEIGALQSLANGQLPADAMMGFGIMGPLQMLSRISIKELDIKVKDRGLMERGIALHKRYNMPVQIGEGSAKSQREKAFEQEAEEMMTQCRSEGFALMTQDPEASCKAVVRFATGDKSTLRITMDPKTPVSIERIASALFGRPNPSMTSALNAEIRS